MGIREVVRCPRSRLAVEESDELLDGESCLADEFAQCASVEFAMARH